MVGGIITSLIMELTLFPAIFYIIKKREVNKLLENKEINIEPAS
jgi:Cu(I)/Ag(I) efflux system membrane protein CusA/SilA